MASKQLQIPGDRKRCRKCGESKHLSDFHRASGMKDGFRGECKVCNNADKRARYYRNREQHIKGVKRWQEANRDRYRDAQRSYKEANKERIQRSNRERHLLKQYGITIRNFELLVHAQFGCCLICNSEEWENLHVDHDHETGAIRGLLCGKCNKAIGLLDEDPNLFQGAERYLRMTKLHEPVWRHDAIS